MGYRIYQPDLTLDELDQVAALIGEGKLGPVSALVYVWVKNREDPKFTMAQLRALRAGDFDIINTPRPTTEVLLPLTESDSPGPGG